MQEELYRKWLLGPNDRGLWVAGCVGGKGKTANEMWANVNTRHKY
jgi:hypothetical protein